MKPKIEYRLDVMVFTDDDLVHFQKEIRLSAPTIRELKVRKKQCIEDWGKYEGELIVFSNFRKITTEINSPFHGHKKLVSVFTNPNIPDKYKK